MITNPEKKWKHYSSLGYILKHTPIVGWWVDGACGFQVVGYFSTKEEVLTEFMKEINRVYKEDQFPAWRLGD